MGKFSMKKKHLNSISSEVISSKKIKSNQHSSTIISQWNTLTPKKRVKWTQISLREPILTTLYPNTPPQPVHAEGSALTRRQVRSKPTVSKDVLHIRLTNTSKPQSKSSLDDWISQIGNFINTRTIKHFMTKRMELRKNTTV